MTEHTSHETPDAPQKQRSTDSESATKMPNNDSRGVVQDGPGTTETGLATEDNSGDGFLTPGTPGIESSTDDNLTDE